MHKHVEPMNNMTHSTYADTHPKNRNCAQINNFVTTDNDEGYDGNKTVVLSTCTRYVCNRVMNNGLQTQTYHEIFDPGTTEHFHFPNTPKMKNPTTNPLKITFPDGCNISSTHNCLMDITQLPVTAQTAHIVPDLAHSTFISIEQFGDAGYRVK